MSEPTRLPVFLRGGNKFSLTRSHGRTDMNGLKTRTTRARFRIIRASGKVEQHILIFDPAELHSLKVNVFVKLHPGDRLEQARPKHPREMCSE